MSSYNCTRYVVFGSVVVLFDVDVTLREEGNKFVNGRVEVLEARSTTTAVALALAT